MNGLRALIAACLVLCAIVACEPTIAPGAVGTPGGPSATGSPPSASVPASGPPALTVDGGVVQITGLGTARSPEFELPAGSAGMTVSVCASNQVIPFVTLFDADNRKLGIIVEPEYELRNLAGGTYYVDVATNPSCVWTIVVTPA